MCSVLGVKNNLTHADSLYHIKMCLWLLPTFELPAAISKPSHMRVPHLHALVIQQHTSPWAHLCWMALSAESERAPEFMHVSSIHGNWADCFFKTILQVLQKHIHFQEVRSYENIYFSEFFFEKYFQTFNLKRSFRCYPSIFLHCAKSLLELSPLFS